MELSRPVEGMIEMSTVVFQQCECGIELKITKMFNECKSVYTCECRREVKISGTILELHYRKDGSEKDQDWVQAEPWRVRG
jgi:hypothetical protein